jgi:hypothetical protein
MSYTVDCLKTFLPGALELLCDSVLNPAFEAEELEEQKARLAFMLEAPEVKLTLLPEVRGRRGVWWYGVAWRRPLQGSAAINSYML